MARKTVPSKKSRAAATRRAPAGKRAVAPAGVQTVAFVSLGCPKNLVDSEKMLGLLVEDGLILVADHQQADAIVINTCGFLEASKDESLQEIQQAVALKNAGRCRRVVVAGCLVQRHRARMLQWCPGIDALIGVFDRDRIVQAVRGAQFDAAAGDDEGGEATPVYSSIAGSAAVAKQRRRISQAGYFEDDSARLRLTPRHYAYLRISEGCNQNCAFCTIPSIRGKMRSKPVDKIVAEAAELMADGAFELNLIGQDTTSYGQDIGYDPGLSGMLGALSKLCSEHGGGWIRLMYAYPSCFTDPMIAALADLPHVLKYIDMPLQHINDQVLTRMRRHTSRALIEKLLGKLRQRVPGIALRTTFISGFPGETAQQHRELVQFVREFGFDAMGVFPYSPEPGTLAGAWHDAGESVDPTQVQERLEELMLTQQEVVFTRNAKLAQEGKQIDVLIDAAAVTRGKATSGVSKGGRLYSGRSKQQAPQIDSITYVQSREDLAPGEVIPCQLLAADGYDLIAAPISELAGNRKLSLAVLRK